MFNYTVHANGEHVSFFYYFFEPNKNNFLLSTDKIEDNKAEVVLLNFQRIPLLLMFRYKFIWQTKTKTFHFDQRLNKLEFLCERFDFERTIFSSFVWSKGCHRKDDNEEFTILLSRWISVRIFFFLRQILKPHQQQKQFWIKISRSEWN